MILTLLTDYGHADEFVGVCHAVARGILPPEVPIVDLTHGVPRHDVRHGALSLRNTLPYVPLGVHVAVVDPQVGTERRAVAVRCADGRVLVGPDNGLLSLAWERSGGATEVIDISRSQHRLQPASATFHGRDVFVPVAAQLAAGAELLDAGDPLPVEELEVLTLPQPRIEGGKALAHALLVDGYGNVSLDLGHDHMMGLGLTIGTRAEVSCGERSATATVVQTFADVPAGEMLVYEDAWGAVALAVNRGDAAAALGVERDAEVQIAPRR
jgi:S-adenosylmethionine hydrolase